MRVLVTGGAGFIGSHIVEALQGNAEVRVLDNLRSGFRNNLEGLEAEWIQGSIEDRDLVRRAVEGVDVVFHLAAMVSVVESIEKPNECESVNVRGLLNVLEESAQARVRKLCFSSSAAVYGETLAESNVESMFSEPQSPYARTKLEGELLCERYREARRLNTVCLRYFNVFGSRQDPRSAYSAAIPIFINKALRNEPITIYGDGTQTRDFIYVKDVARANLHFSKSDALHGVYNVALGKQCSITELCEKIVALTGSHSPITHVPARAGEVKHSRACVDKLLATGFQCGPSLEDGLKLAINYYRGSSDYV